MIDWLAGVLGAPLARRDPWQRADAIVVLGAPLSAGGGLTAPLDERVRAGVELWRRGAAPLLVVTGGGPPGRVEADAMAERALALGVPASALRVERHAATTADNARLVATLLGAEPCHTVWVVSQPFHLRRACILFRRAGLAPLAWHADDSIQFCNPRRALRWIAREYAAMAGMIARDARAGLGGLGGLRGRGRRRRESRA